MKKSFWFCLLVFSVFIGLSSCSTDDEEKEKKATDVVDSTNPADEEKEKTAPGAVVSESIKFELKSGTKNTLVVSWEKPKDDGGVPITGYTVRYYPKSGEKTPKTKSSPEKQNSKGITPPPPSKKTKSLSKEIFTKDVKVDDNIKGNIITVEIDISKFPPNTVYVFEIIAKKADGEISFTEKEYTTAKDKPVPPYVPQNIIFKEVNDKSLKVIWEKPDSDGGSPITKYTVEYAESTDASSITWKSKEIEINDDEATLELEIDGLKADKEYLFRVAAVNKDAGEGDYSKAKGHKTLAIGEPLNLNVSNLTNTSFTLSWEAVDYPDGHTLKSYSITKVYDDENGQKKSDEVASGIATDKTSHDITGLEKGKTYKFVVASIFEDAEGNKDKHKNTIEVTMVIVAVNSISLDNDTLGLVVGDKKTLTATIDPPNATNQKVSWSSDDTSIATVDSQSGEVTAVAVGTATITATTADGGQKASCDVTVNPVSVKGVTLDKTTLSLVMGAKKTLKATIDPSNATNKKVSWSSDKTNIATVDDSGEVTALKVGQATITVTTADGGKKASCTVNVTPVSVKGVTLDNTTLDLVVGDKKTLTATIDPSKATNKKVSWSSSDKNIATVDDSGEVTALKVGQATITATTADGGKKATCSVIVNPIVVSTKQELKNLIYKRMQAAGYNGNANDPGTDIDLNDIDVSQLIDLNHLFFASPGIALPHLHHFNGDISKWDVSNVTNMDSMFLSSKFNGDISNWTVSNVENMKSMFENSQFNQDISNWTVSKVTDMRGMFDGNFQNFDNGGNPDGLDGWRIAPSVNKGSMFNNSKLQADNNLPCWADGNLDNCPVTGVDLNQKTLSLVKGTEETLTAIFEPVNTPNKGVSWSSDKTNIATVNQNGTVKAVSAGQAIITVTTNDGGYTARCKVYVTDSNVAVNSVSLDKTLDSGVGEKKTLTATIDPPGATNQKVRWKSSEPTIATVDQSGEVTALKVGQATITVTTDDGDYTATCAVTVTPIVVSTKKQLRNIIYQRMQSAGYKGNSGDPGTNIDLNDIDISQLTELKSLFENAGDAESPYLHHFNGDISKWDVSNVTNMYSMFYDSKFNGDISNWNVSKVENMQWMFGKSQFNGTISNWKVDNVTDMFKMFHSSKFNGDISKWNVSKVINMDYMFFRASNFYNGGKPDGLDGWKVVKTVDKTDIFKGTKLERDNNLPCWADGDLSDCPNP